MIHITIISPRRTHYDIRECANESMTVEQFIEELRENCNSLDDKVVFSNDGGYTYGIINARTVESEECLTKEEEMRMEYLEELTDCESERNIELTNLMTRYENSIEDDEGHILTDEEYEVEVKAINDEYDKYVKEIKKRYEVL